MNILQRFLCPVPEFWTGVRNEALKGTGVCASLVAAVMHKDIVMAAWLLNLLKILVIIGTTTATNAQFTCDQPTPPKTDDSPTS